MHLFGPVLLDRRVNLKGRWEENTGVGGDKKMYKVTNRGECKKGEVGKKVYMRRSSRKAASCYDRKKVQSCIAIFFGVVSNSFQATGCVEMPKETVDNAEKNGIRGGVSKIKLGEGVRQMV